MSGKQQQSDDKAKGIVDNLKKNPVTILAVLLAAFVVLSAMTVASIMVVKKHNNAQPTVVGGAQGSTMSVRISDLQNQVKLLFFDYGITKDSFSEVLAQDPATGVRTSVVHVAVSEERAEQLRLAVLTLFAQNKFTPLYSTGQYHLVTGDDAYRFELYINTFDAGPQGASTPQAQPQTLPDVAPSSVQQGQGTVALPPKGKGQIGLIIDDAGMNLYLADQITKLNIPMTISILPYQPHSRETAELSHSRGKSVFLHFPMEPIGYPATDPGPGAVLLNMPEVMIAEIAKQNVENIGKIDGVNNHMGSAVTSNDGKMRQVFAAIKPYTNYFVDSNTSSTTVAFSVCQDSDLICGKNGRFLDNENNHNYIRQKLFEAAQTSDRRGGIIVIGHLRPDTIQVLIEVVPELTRLGYEFVKVENLMK